MPTLQALAFWYSSRNQEASDCACLKSVPTYTAWPATKIKFFKCCAGRGIALSSSAKPMSSSWRRDEPAICNHDKAWFEFGKFRLQGALWE